MEPADGFEPGRPPDAGRAGPPFERDQERRATRIAKAEVALAKLAAVKRLMPNAQKIASEAGRTLLTLKAHKYFSYEVDVAGVLCWARTT